eukprot:1571523-Rhodomonas_salina.2
MSQHATTHIKRIARITCFTCITHVAHLHPYPRSITASQRHSVTASHYHSITRGEDVQRRIHAANTHHAPSMSRHTITYITRITHTTHTTQIILVRLITPSHPGVQGLVVNKGPALLASFGCRVQAV